MNFKKEKVNKVLVTLVYKNVCYLDNIYANKEHTNKDKNMYILVIWRMLYGKN